MSRSISVLEFSRAQSNAVRPVTIGLSPKTIANHQSAIKQKLEAETAIELLHKANKLGLES